MQQQQQQEQKQELTQQQQQWAQQQQQQPLDPERGHDLVRLHHLLALANLELKRIEERIEPGIAQEIDARLRHSLEAVEQMYFTGPHGYNPQPTFEKCECGHYRLKK